MSKNIEELKELAEEEKGFERLRLQDLVLCYIIPILEDFEKRLKRIEAELGIYTEKEVKKIKVGGTDPD